MAILPSEGDDLALLCNLFFSHKKSLGTIIVAFETFLYARPRYGQLRWQQQGQQGAAGAAGATWGSRDSRGQQGAAGEAAGPASILCPFSFQMQSCRETVKQLVDSMTDPDMIPVFIQLNKGSLHSIPSFELDKNDAINHSFMNSRFGPPHAWLTGIEEIN